MSILIAMDWLLILNVLRVIVAIIILGFASYYDIQTRTVSNKLWIILGLIAISLFECQLILEFEFDAFQYLIIILPITCLFMSFLVCDWVVDFESRKLNHSWVFMLILSGAAFFYLFNSGSSEWFENFSLGIPIILFLLYFISMETTMNYLDYRLYFRLQRRLEKKKDSKKGDEKHRDKPVKIAQLKNTKANTKSPSSSSLNNNPTSESDSTNSLEPDERISQALFFWLFLFYILVFILDEIVMMSLVRILGLVFLAFVPIILIILYSRYHAQAKPLSEGKSSDEQDKDNNNEISDADITQKERQIIQTLHYLNHLSSIGLIFFGFFLIIYYSVLVQISEIMMICYSIMIWLVMFYGFYNLGLPRGGADTKALMCLVLLFPIYPIISNVTFQTSFYNLLSELQKLGVEYVFPFAFTALMNGALIMLIFIICLFFFNVSRRNLKLPHAFLGYKLPIKEVPHKFVWPMERIMNGKRKLMVFPGNDIDFELELKELRKAGLKVIWVSPKIPFIIPLTGGVILTVILGNLLFEMMLGLF